MRRLLPGAAAVLTLLLAVWQPLAAQTVRGTVIRSTDAAPIIGVVVLLVDSAEVGRARGLSDASGNFALRAPRPGEYRIRTLRIGFTATTGSPFRLRSDTTVRITLDQIPVNLPAVTAEERNECREGAESGLATAIVWDEARTAILAADITLRDLDYRFEMMLHSRKLDTRPPPLLLESVFGRVRHEGVQPWTSFPPETLEARGYVSPTEDGLRYVAPDLTVLLSPYFTRTHCFRLRETSRDASALELEFRPLARIRRSEIKGVMRLDATTRALRTVEFTYVNLPETVRDTLAGGEIEFARLANGAWIIPRWLIRAPIPVRSALADTVIVAGSPISTWRSDWFVVPTTSRLRVTGGDVIFVRQGADTTVLWSRPMSTLVVQTLQRGATGLEPAGGVQVAFAGSTEQEVTDPRGEARFPGLVGGEYAVEVSTPYYAAFGIEPERLVETFTQEPRTATQRVRVRTLGELARDACGEKPNHAVLLGTVVRDGQVLVGAGVAARIPRRATSNLDEARTARARTTIEGRYAICDIPVGVEIFITVTAVDGSRFSKTTVIERGETVSFLDLDFPVRP
jgi:Carboxypeptidase regulatory-like domain